MPYQWTRVIDPASRQPIKARLDLWPYRSLPRQGFVWVIGITATALTLPLLAVVGTRAMWGLLPFALLAIWALWYGIEKTYASGRKHEYLELTRDRLSVTRSDPGQADRIWQTNPYWIRAKLRQDGPVEDYLTLTDGQREIELGAFLTPEERQALRHELTQELAAIR